MPAISKRLQAPFVSHSLCHQKWASHAALASCGYSAGHSRSSTATTAAVICGPAGSPQFITQNFYIQLNKVCSFPHAGRCSTAGHPCGLSPGRLRLPSAIGLRGVGLSLCLSLPYARLCATGTSLLRFRTTFSAPLVLSFLCAV